MDVVMCLIFSENGNLSDVVRLPSMWTDFGSLCCGSLIVLLECCTTFDLIIGLVRCVLGYSYMRSTSLIVG